jgi:serine/threonine protein kinase
VTQSSSADVSQRRTVRKPVDEDCLLGGQLHPSVVERLERVRELPVISVANLLGVERDEKGVWLVWQFVPGTPLEKMLKQTHSPGQREKLIRELRLSVTAMHAHGIVHGAIHPRNVIIDPEGRVHLTHISPLLWDDPAADDYAVEEIAQMLGVTADPKSIDTAIDDAEDYKVRRGAYLRALGAAVFGILLFVAILWYIRA